jgi:deoxyribodipyrimidine photolyase-like uncharacterized protein
MKTLSLQPRMFASYADPDQYRITVYWATVSHALRLAKMHISINSLEGFIRQIIGRREFMYIMSLSDVSSVRATLGVQAKICRVFIRRNRYCSYYDTIKKCQDRLRASHRALDDSNPLALLCEFDPNEV